MDGDDGWFAKSLVVKVTDIFKNKTKRLFFSRLGLAHESLTRISLVSFDVTRLVMRLSGPFTRKATSVVVHWHCCSTQEFPSWASKRWNLSLSTRSTWRWALDRTVTGPRSKTSRLTASATSPSTKSGTFLYTTVIVYFPHDKSRLLCVKSFDGHSRKHK